MYRSMQADYTRKTQEIAPYRALGVDAAKAQEALSVYDNLQNPEFQKALYDKLAESYANAEPVDLEEDDPRDKQFSELSNRIAAFESRAIQQEVESDIAKQEAIIRTENPGWGDDEMQTVAQLSFSHNGNLIKGAETFKALQNTIISRHIEKKASVPGSIGAPVPSANAEVPQEGFKDLDEAHKAAMAYWRSHQD